MLQHKQKNKCSKLDVSDIIRQSYEEAKEFLEGKEAVRPTFSIIRYLILKCLCMFCMFLSLLYISIEIEVQQALISFKGLFEFCHGLILACWSENVLL